MEQINMVVQERVVAQKGQNKALRRKGQVPAIVYHKNEPSKAVSLDEKSFRQALNTEAGRNVLINLQIEGKKADEKTVVISEIQYDPVKRNMLHIDFHQVALDEQIQIAVPVRTLGEAIAVKNDGALLETPTREIEVECLPTNMPEHIDVDVSGLELNHVIHARDLVLPAGVTLVSDEDEVIAQCVKHEAELEDAAEEEGTSSEPEVIGEKKEADTE
ncbi:MAG: 50S ribosomal protein L25 [Candidatus Omnitrophica bacterium]|nr:50S ribosomal protein L25 [Candidatus Omnitrophota bacterium]